MSALVQIPDSRYVELRAMDVIKFGTSTREYVLLHDQL
jgi:smad nuclear-interacting protein 1